jgi:hypothetical protein
MATSDIENSTNGTPTASQEEKGYEEFEIGEHRVPWFLWLFFSAIITWASISWIPFFGY